MYELIAKNKRKSWLIFFAMGILLLALGGGLGFIFDSNPMSGQGVAIGIVVAFIIWLVQALIAYKRGAKVILSTMEAQEITKNDDPTLYNIIEELSMVSGLPMPKIYIINTDAMNAFATGTKIENSVVAITRGLRQRLNRQEIQAVMAHEMSHIYNRDIVYMTFASIMMCTIVLISQILTRSFFYGGINNRRSSSDDGKNGVAQVIIIAIVIVLAIFSALLSQLFYFSLSRKREYLADTMAVNFTHDPNALADALQKISGDNVAFDPGKMASAMCISKPNLDERVATLFSTHPPITKRIDILRAMSQGTSYENYCQAYQKVMGKNDLPKFRS